jgi:hypothetical protein
MLERLIKMNRRQSIVLLGFPGLHTLVGKIDKTLATRSGEMALSGSGAGEGYPRRGLRLKPARNSYE